MEALRKNLDLFNQQLINKNFEALTENEGKDWGLQNDLSEDQIVELANELISELYSTRCENKNSWMYQL